MIKRLLLIFSLLSVFNTAFSKDFSSGKLVAPPNDNCSAATVLTVNSGTTCSSTTTASFTAATSSGVPAATCALSTASAQDIWYQFTATATVHSIGLQGFSGTAQPVIMALYQGGCDNLEQIFCSANNVIVANTLTIGQTYLLRLYYNMASPSLSTSFTICVTTPPPSSNLDCSINTINYSFETPTPLTGGNGPTFIDHNTVQGWRTTANDQIMEYWPSPSYEGVSAYQGSQFIELNANANQGTMGVYQDFSTPQPTIFTVKFAHRGRLGTDTCKLMAGPPGGPYTDVYTAQTSNAAWVYHGQAPLAAITYTVPDNQPVTRFFFQAVSTATGNTSVGNFLDAITFTATNIILTENPNYMNCGEITLDISATGFGTWTAHADNPSAVTIADPTSQDTTLSNFGEPGVYYFDWGTDNCISTLEVNYTGPEPGEPAVTNVTYCQGQEASPLIAAIDEGNTQNWYYGGGMYNSPPTPSTATLGTQTYYVSQTSPNGCESIAASLTVTVTTASASVTGFTLPAAVCAGGPNVLPTPAAGFTNGGTYSAATGLDIDGTTGEIDLSASTPGSYTVTYSIPADAGNCLSPGSSTANITINAAPELVEPDDLETCDDDFDGLAVFNLTMAGNQAVSGQAGLSVTYHHSLEDAQTGDDDIETPAAYLSEVSDNQTVYIRAIQTGTTTNCYSVEEVQLTVHPRPAVPVISNYVLCDDPATTGNVATFDLTTKSNEATGGVAGVTVTYYTSQDNAQSDTDAIDNPDVYTNTASPETIWVRLENEFGCVTVSSFNLVVNPLPAVAQDLEPFRECEDANGQGTFNLTAIAPQIVNGATGYTVTFYATQAEADEEDTDNALPASFTTGGTTIFAHVRNNATLCTTTTTVELEVVAAPELVAATPLEECDDDNNGIAVFNLTIAGDEVINGQTGLFVTYHESEDEALTGDEDLDAAEIIAYSSTGQTIYIRVIQQGTTDECATVVPVSLIVHPRPVIPALADYALCDDNNSPDGIEEFDLTTRNTLATSNTSDVVTWYASQDAANAGTTPVDDATAFSSSTNTQAWVRVENTFGCYSVAPLTLVVHPLPAVAQNMEPFYACEETPGVGLFDFDEIDPVVTQGASGYSVAYYETPEQAAGGLDDYLTSPHPSASAVIYARVENVVTGCSVIAPVTLEVLPAPIAPELAPLQECDDNNDGIATFSLSGTIAGIEAALGNTVEVTVHYTPEDADFGTNEITNITAFTNNDPGTQTLYLRVESSQTECFDVAELVLIVNPAPVATTPSGPYVLCDNGTSDTDGVGVFDLTLYEEEVLGTLDPALYSVTYFNNEAQAMAGTPAIATPASYNSTTTDGDAPEDAIYIRVTNNATGCYDLVELELIVNPLPTALQPTEPYTLCDDNTDPEDPGVEFEIFDLTSKIDEITDGLDGVTVTFYQEYADAVGLVNGISNPEAYVNATPAVETIFVRVTDNETGCYRIVLQDIRVEPLPLLVMPSDAETTACDTDGDGYATFDLTALIEGMLNTGTDITVRFYETAEDALEGINAIPNPEAYVNSNPFLQTIYVVGENDLTGCQSPLWSFALHVTESPQAPDLEDIVQCDDQDNDGQDGQAYFDLTIYEADIYETIDTEPGTLTIQYFTSEAYADAGAPRIINPSHYNGTHEQEIWVRVELTGTECYSLSSFQLMLNRPQALNRPSMLVLCNEALDGNEENDIYTTFDLTVKDAEILGPMGIGIGNVVTYHETQAAAQDGVDAITPATAYENESNPQVLYVRVVTPEGCVSFTTLTIKVLPLPTPDFTPDALELCDTNNTGDGVEPFNLTDAQDDIADNDFTVSFAYYPTEADVYAGTNEIVAPQTYVSGSGSVWVKVMANTNNATDPVCFQVVELPLIVHPLPAQGTIAPYAICEQNTDGFATFDFNTHMDEILGPDVDPADYGDYTVRFSYNGANVPYIYTNVVQGSQTIDVYVEYEPTACSTTVQLTLLVEEQAIAYEVTTPDFDVCDNDGDNDGFYVIDLTQADADIIGVQNPAIHAVTYYTSEQDALDGTNAIATPATFNATTQTIWARIVNTSTVSGCPDFTSFEVVIELLPEPVISTDGDVHTICVDFATGEVLRPLLLQSGVTPNGHTYDWYHNGQLVDTNQNGTYLAEEPGSYTVIVTGPAPNGCISDVSAAFEVIQSGPPSPIGQGFVVSNAFGEDQTITVLVEGYGEYQYSLYPEGPWQNSNVFTNVSPGEHTVYIRDITADPCTDPYDTVTNVSVINYPHYFTPNGDGYNDTWNIIGLAGEDYQAIIYIFDRYGKLIKQISPDGEGWDGTYNGYPVTADDYWFTVEFNEGLYRRTVKAHFALKR